MKKILYVELTNFQCHKNLVVNFSDFTAIVGPSDKGKTAILRAIRWALYNNPNGDKFITRGAKQCTVSIFFNDGTVIKRSKGAEGNTYDITYSNGKQLHMQDFGTGSIEEVVNAHGMIEIDLFGSKQSLNICRQLDNPFFLGETPTNKAVMIGKLGKTDVIDLSIKNTASEVRSRNSKLKIYKADLKSVKSDLSELKGLDTMEKNIIAAEDKLEQLQYIESKITNIKSATQKLQNYKVQQSSLEKICECGSLAEESLEIINEALEINNKIILIKGKMDILKSYENQRAELNNLLESISLIDINEIIEQIDETISIANNIKSTKLLSNKLKELLQVKDNLMELPQIQEINDVLLDIDDGVEVLKSLSRIKPINNNLKSSIDRQTKGQTIISKLDTQYTKVVSEYKDALTESNTCPMCMSNITNTQLDSIEDYI